MYSDGPISVAPYSALSQGDPFPWIELYGVYGTEAPQLREGPWTLVYSAFAGDSKNIIILDGRYSVEADAFVEMAINCRFAVDGVSLEEAPLTGVYSALGATFKEMSTEMLYKSTGVIQNFSLLSGTYQAIGQPTAEMRVDVQYSVIGVSLQSIAIDCVFAVTSPVNEFVFFDGQFSVAVPEFTESPFDMQWLWNYAMKKTWVIAYGDQVRKRWTVKYQIGTTRVKKVWAIGSRLLTRVKKVWSIEYGINTFNEVKKTWRLPSTIVDGSVIVESTQPLLTVGGQQIKLDNVNISADEGQYAWTCQFELTNVDHYSLFELDTPFTITLGGETYSFVCSEPSFGRSDQVEPSASIAGISPSVQYSDTHATLVSKEWESPTLVSEILEEVFGPGIVELQVADWVIPAKRLSVEFQSPIAIARQIAEATGGTLESELDGSLYIRYLYPIGVPFFETTEPDHVYDDVRDEFTMREDFTYQRIENLFRVLDSAADEAGILILEIDDREDGFNNGRTSFVPGEQPVVLVYKGEDVTLDNVESSAGSVVPVEEGATEVEEDIEFVDVTEAQVRYPIESIVTFKWLGNDLGTPTISGQRGLAITAAGVGLLKITYTTRYIAKRLVNVPAVLNGETEYGVIVMAEGTQS